MSIDMVDRKILDLLQSDARQSYREIGKALGISHGNVASRIRRLEDQKVIQSYRVILDPDQLDLYPICLRVSVKSGTNLQTIATQLLKKPQIQFLMRTSGDYDFLMYVLCNERKDALTLIQDVSNIKGLDKVETHVVLETLKIYGCPITK